MLHRAEVWSGLGGGCRLFSQDQMGVRNMSAEPDSGDHLDAAAQTEVNTHTAAVTLPDSSGFSSTLTSPPP